MEKTKIVFVEPTGAQANVFAKSMTIPLLGPVYLATIVKKAGYDVIVLNENILGRKVKASEIKDADILCLSCISASVTRGEEIAKQYKRIRPDGKTIIGGIHASLMPRDVAPFFDQVVVGEAENIILDLLSGRIKNKIVYADRPVNLDELPLPSFKLIKEWQKIKTWSAMTSRGCPYDCTFCAVTEMFGRKYRTQSPERVIREVMRYKRGEVFFSDDHFAANMTRTNKLIDLMKVHGFNRPWSAQVRTEISKKPEFVAKMRNAGCKTVYIGFESINDQSLLDMNKHQTVKDIERSIKVFHDHGITIHGMFMLGNDSDTKDVFKRTSEFCRKSGLDYAQYAVLTPLPGTQLFHQLEKQKRLLHKKWEYYDGLHAVFKPKNMSPLQLHLETWNALAKFYSPKEIAKRYVRFDFFGAFLRSYGNRINKEWLRFNAEFGRILEQANCVELLKQLVPQPAVVEID